MRHHTWLSLCLLSKQFLLSSFDEKAVRALHFLRRHTSQALQFRHVQDVLAKELIIESWEHTLEESKEMIDLGSEME